jgi:hypothetical protein
MRGKSEITWGPFKGRFPRVEKSGETTAVSEQNGGIWRSGERDGTRKRGGTRRPVSTEEWMGEKTEKLQGLITRVGCWKNPDGQSLSSCSFRAPSGAQDQILVFFKRGFVEKERKKLNYITVQWQPFFLRLSLYSQPWSWRLHFPSKRR